MQFKLLLLVAFSSLTLVSLAQCDAGETQVHVMVDTDNWGYELYWEITPAGNECGDGTLISGGNSVSVGCEAEDDGSPEDEGAYSNNNLILEGPFCLAVGDYTLHHRDGYGDGGNNLIIYDNLVQTAVLNGEGFSSELTFTLGEEPEGPSNQFPCGALDITVDGPGEVVNNSDALTQLGEPTPPLVYCATPGFWCGSDNGANNSLWMKFVAPESGRVEVSTCNEDNNFDTELAVYSVGECSDYSTYTVIGANDDAQGGCNEGATTYASVMTVSCLTPGEEYYIQLDGWNGSNGETRITVTDLGDSSVPPVLSLIEDDINCYNGTGALTTTVSSDYGVNYTVEWTGPNGYTDSGFYVNGLEAGEYTAVVTNDCGLNLTASTTLTEPEPFLVASTVEDAGCNNSGSVELFVDGAVPPYEFQWYYEGEPYSEDQNISNLAPGNYTYVIEDDNGCNYEGEVTVEGEDSFSFYLGPDTTICSDQELLLYGPPGVDYEWQDGSMNQFFIVDANELGPGTYYFTVNATNDEGCEATDAVLVTIVTCTGVEEYTFDTHTIYPNPTDGIFRLDNLPEIESGWLRILDSRGQLVLRKPLDSVSGQRLEIDATGLERGLYIIQLIDGKRTSSSKLIIE